MSYSCTEVKYEGFGTPEVQIRLDSRNLDNSTLKGAGGQTQMLWCGGTEKIVHSEFVEQDARILNCI